MTVADATELMRRIRHAGAIFIGRNRIVPWLFRWLVFRLYFLSGAVKLLGGDPNWRNLSAVGFHWHTQPLPTVLAWCTTSTLRCAIAITL